MCPLGRVGSSPTLGTRSESLSEGSFFFGRGFASSDLRMPLGGDRMTEIDNLLFPWPIPSDIRMASKSMAKTECFILQTSENHGHLSDMVWFE